VSRPSDVVHLFTDLARPLAHEAEVEHDHTAFARDEHVRRLEIRVQLARVVQRADRVLTGERGVELREIRDGRYAHHPRRRPPFVIAFTRILSR